MAIGGLWHGANWTFLAWGLFHGVLLAINHGWRFFRGSADGNMFGRWAGWFTTFTAFAIGMVLFRADDMAAATNMLAAMSGFGEAPPPTTLTLEADRRWIARGYVSELFVLTWFGNLWSVNATLATAGAIAVALFVPDTMEISRYTEGDIRSKWRRSSSAIEWRPTLTWCTVVGILFVVSVVQMGRSKEFLYYQF